MLVVVSINSEEALIYKKVMDYTVTCVEGVETSCVESCVGIEQCSSPTCQCRILINDASGPWGDFMDVLFVLLCYH